MAYSDALKSTNGDAVDILIVGRHVVFIRGNTAPTKD